MLIVIACCRTIDVGDIVHVQTNIEPFIVITHGSIRQIVIRQEPRIRVIFQHNAPFNLEAILTAENGGSGLVKFRQNSDTARIINLDTWVRDLLPNHAYMLQRAVDPVATWQCLSTAWLTLGLGLQPKALITDNKGRGTAPLWRDITAIPRGTQFNIHFQVIDSVTSAVVLTSDCYQYTVR